MKDLKSVCGEIETPREVQYSVAEHEILLSFNGDSDAEKFHDWWGVHGEIAFRTWLATTADCS